MQIKRGGEKIVSLISPIRANLLDRLVLLGRDHKLR